MTFLELAVLALLLLVTVERAVAVTYFLIRCRWRAAPLGEDDMPRVLVVLALRGSDPSLVDCLRSLFQQDYPHYQVRLVVDHRSDLVNGGAAYGGDRSGNVHADAFEPLLDEPFTRTFDHTTALWESKICIEWIGQMMLIPTSVSSFNRARPSKVNWVNGTMSNPVKSSVV